MTTKIEKIILESVKKFNQSPYIINNGNCDLFAQYVIEKMGGETNSLYGLASDMFGDFGVLNKNFKSKYGNAPKKVKRKINLNSHVWIYYRGRHYDAETPKGVQNFLNLSIFKKAVNRAS